MGCGVPIVGYANEAFAGLAGIAGVGALVDSKTPATMAATISELYKNPDKLRSDAKKSLRFARNNSFEKTFRKRIEHIDETMISSRNAEGEPP